jgi:hypothetical protein
MWSYLSEFSKIKVSGLKNGNDGASRSVFPHRYVVGRFGKLGPVVVLSKRKRLRDLFLPRWAFLVQNAFSPK